MRIIEIINHDMTKKYSSSSRLWLKRHFNDPYVQKAHRDRLRSRSWFKLCEIQKSDKIFLKGKTVVDLGSAPGGWSQYAITQVGVTGKVIACDVLPMNPLTGVDFFQGNLCNKLIMHSFIKYIGNKKVQVVISDMAPSLTGESVIDIPRAMCLMELGLEISRHVLALGGSFIVKAFHSTDFRVYLKKICSLFTKVKIRKPHSSSSQSKEVYIVAHGLKHKSQIVL